MKKAKIYKYFKLTLPLWLMGASAFLCYYFGAFRFLQWEVLQKIHGDIQGYVSIHPILSFFAYLGIYGIYSLSAMPGLFALDVAGGCFLSQPFVTLAIAAGGMLGATPLYLAAKYAFKEYFASRNGGFIEKVKEKFEKHQTSYLLFVRLFPFFPFGLVNIALAFLNIRTRTFMWTTFVGLLPAAYIYSEAGRGIGHIFASSTPFAFASLCTFPMIFSLMGIGLLALLPIFFNRRKKSADLD